MATTYTLTMHRPLSLADYRAIRFCALGVILDFKHAPDGGEPARQREVMREALVRARYGYYRIGAAPGEHNIY